MLKRLFSTIFLIFILGQNASFLVYADETINWANSETKTESSAQQTTNWDSWKTSINLENKESEQSSDNQEISSESQNNWILINDKEKESPEWKISEKEESQANSSWQNIWTWTIEEKQENQKPKVRKKRDTEKEEYPIANLDFITISSWETEIIDVLANDGKPWDNLQITRVDPLDPNIWTINIEWNKIKLSMRRDAEAWRFITYYYVTWDNYKSEWKWEISIYWRWVQTTFEDDEVETEMNNPIEIDILANDTAFEDEYKVAWIYDVSIGWSFEVIWTGRNTKVKFTPERDFIWTVTGEYEIATAWWEWDITVWSAIIKVNVKAKSEGPYIANDDESQTGKNQWIILDILANDTAPRWVEFIIENEENWTFETFDFWWRKVVNFTPDRDFVWVAKAKYWLLKNWQKESSANITVRVIDWGWRRLKAHDDQAETNKNESVIIDILENDLAPLNNPFIVWDEENWTFEIVEDWWRKKVEFTPNQDFVWIAKAKYRLLIESVESPGTFREGPDANITVNVKDRTQRNNPPVAVDDILETNKNTSLDIDVLANDSDPDWDDISITQLTAINWWTFSVVWGKVRFIAETDFVWIAKANYEITDTKWEKATAKIEINVKNVPINRAPIAIDDEIHYEWFRSVEINVLANDSDPDWDAISITKIENSQNWNFVIVWNKIKFSNDKTSGLHTAIATYEISDTKWAKTTAKLTLHFWLPSDDEAETSKNQPVVVDVSANDWDFKLVSVENNSSNWTFQIITQSGSKFIKFAPNIDFVWTVETIYKASRYSDLDSREVEVPVKLKVIVKWTPVIIPAIPINRTPKAVNDFAEIEKNTSIEIDVLANDSDPDWDAISITKVESPQNWSFQIIWEKIKFIANRYFIGEAKVIYEIKDIKWAKSKAEVKVKVKEAPTSPYIPPTPPAPPSIPPIVPPTSPIIPSNPWNWWSTPNRNMKPLAIDDNLETLKNIPIEIDVLANDSDPEGDSIFITKVENFVNWTFRLENGKVFFNPDRNFVWEARAIYEIKDTNWQTDSANIFVNVRDITPEFVENPETKIVPIPPETYIPQIPGINDIPPTENIPQEPVYPLLPPEEKPMIPPKRYNPPKTPVNIPEEDEPIPEDEEKTIPKEPKLPNPKELPKTWPDKLIIFLIISLILPSMYLFWKDSKKYIK